jgi:hypothetical protein
MQLAVMYQKVGRFFVALFALLMAMESVGMAIYKNHCPKSGKTSITYFFNSCCCNQKDAKSCCDVQLELLTHQADCFSQFHSPKLPTAKEALQFTAYLPVLSQHLFVVHADKNVVLQYSTSPPPPSGKEIRIVNQVFLI